jgi:cell division protein FtsI/penicillin-binding protein 2
MEEIWDQIRDPERRYALLATEVPPETGEAIAALSLRGIYLEPQPRRWYPNGPLAGHMLGFVNRENVAVYGVEAYYDEELRGRKGSQFSDGLEYRLIPPRDGYDVVLTIDRAVQSMVEERLAAAVARYEATGGDVVVVDPRTGAILAMASYPPFDPNEYASTPPERWANPAIAIVHEPGSVVKVLTMAAGLQAGVVTPESTYEDVGTIEYGGIQISNWDRKSHGVTSMTRLLQLSLNVGAVHIADALGRERFYDFMRKFGFGEPTGIDLAGEVGGILRTPDDPGWYPADLATNSFGQGVAVTPLQITMAVAALANGGVLMRPYVVDRIVDGEVVIRKARPQPVRRVVSEAVADAVSEMMVAVVEGRVTNAMVPGYTVAGKTATAQIPTPDGYEKHGTIASFVGFVPADEPRFVMLVKIDRPNRPRGSESAAPAFAEIAAELVRLLDIPPDGVRLARR